METNNKFASDEEKWFSWWLDDLVAAGYVNVLLYQYPKFIFTLPVEHTVEKILKTKVKMTPKTLLRECSYTPDFNITWTDKAQNIFAQEKGYIVLPMPLFITQNGRSLIDVKGSYEKDTPKAKFSLNQKILYLVHGRYVQKIKIPDLFKKTFTPSNPEFYLTKKTRKPRKINWEVRTLDDFIQISKGGE